MQVDHTPKANLGPVGKTRLKDRSKQYKKGKKNNYNQAKDRKEIKCLNGEGAYGKYKSKEIKRNCINIE
jgi:hypothetical protein